jgi:acetyl esterase
MRAPGRPPGVHEPLRYEPEPGLGAAVRQRFGRALFDYGLRGLANLGQLHPSARPHRHGVEVLTDLPYLDPDDGSRDHRLDIYRPLPEKGAKAERDHRAYGPPYPVVLYIHGGGFRILSKDTHWVMALAMARRGMLVFNINYRLSPQHPFPAALIDCCAALAYVARQAAALGGDPRRLVLAGESAGANLVTALTLLTCVQRQEPWAQRVFELGLVPAAALPMCGMLQVSDSERFARRKQLPQWVSDRLTEVTHAYLRQSPAEQLDLADPLCLLERGPALARPLPPFFAGVGTRDPLLDDTRRLGQALTRLQVPHELRYYPGELHAFHALVYRAQAKQCWRDQFTFLDRYLGAA